MQYLVLRFRQLLLTRASLLLFLLNKSQPRIFHFQLLTRLQQLFYLPLLHFHDIATFTAKYTAPIFARRLGFLSDLLQLCFQLQHFGQAFLLLFSKSACFLPLLVQVAPNELKFFFQALLLDISVLSRTEKQTLLGLLAG